MDVPESEQIRKVINAAIVALVLVLGLILPVLATYAMGGILVFGANSCYSEALGFVADESQRVAESKDAKLTSKFSALMSNLPLYGYETNCDEVSEVIEQYKAETVNWPP